MIKAPGMALNDKFWILAIVLCLQASFFQVPRFPLKSNTYLVITSYTILYWSLFKCLLSDTILLESAFGYFATKILCVRPGHQVHLHFHITIHS